MKYNIVIIRNRDYIGTMYDIYPDQISSALFNKLIDIAPDNVFGKDYRPHCEEKYLIIK